MPVSFAPTMRATQYSTKQAYVPQMQNLNNCNNTLCYTYNHGYIYKPHTGYGIVGRSAAGYLGCRKRL